MKALAAAGPHVFVKVGGKRARINLKPDPCSARFSNSAQISMLAYTDKNWDKPGSVVPGLVRETIELFGVERCVYVLF